MTAPLVTPAAPGAAVSDPAPLRERLWLFPKEHAAPLSRNFDAAEFRCRCASPACHFTLLHPRLVETLQTLRELVAQPLPVSSGFRCAVHNRAVGGAWRSYHTRGMAADLLCRGPLTPDELAAAALRIPAVGGVGTYATRGFVHVDVRPRTGAAPTRWNG